MSPVACTRSTGPVTVSTLGQPTRSQVSYNQGAASGIDRYAMVGVNVGSGCRR